MDVYFIEKERVEVCRAPSQACEHHHYFYLASAARKLLEGYQVEYHLDAHGEIEQCRNRELCLFPNHFDSRKEVVGYHRETYDFSGPWRPLENPYVSLLEREFSDIVKLLVPRVLTNSRNVIFPYEIDCYAPDLGVAFEFNGDYWHSDEKILERYGVTAKEYHKRKVDRCHAQKIALGFVWEQNWLQHRETVVDAAADLLQFKRLSPVVKQWSAPLPPADLYWESVDRQGMQRHRTKVEGKLQKRLPKRAEVSPKLEEEG